MSRTDGQDAEVCCLRCRHGEGVNNQDMELDTRDAEFESGGEGEGAVGYRVWWQ